MATVTSRKAQPDNKFLTRRRTLAEELLELNVKHAKTFAEMARLEAELKRIATESGDSFKEDFGARGHVSVAGAVGKEFKGEVPQIVTEAWQQLSAAERKAYLKSGVVRMFEQFSKASNGRVTVKVL